MPTMEVGVRQYVLRCYVPLRLLKILLRLRCFLLLGPRILAECKILHTLWECVFLTDMWLEMCFLTRLSPLSARLSWLHGPALTGVSCGGILGVEVEKYRL